MNARMPRRDFLKAAPATAGLLAAAQRPAPPQGASRTQAEVKLSGTAYTPNPDYPRQAKPASEVTLKGNFWKPKIMTNAEVTIPFEMRKSGQQ